MKPQPDANCSVEERVGTFKNLVVGHPALKNAYAPLEAAVLTPSNTSLVMVSGPTGIGKTTLMTRARNKMVQHFSAMLIENPGFIPFVIVRAPACDGTKYPWRELNLRILRELQEPHVQTKVAPASTVDCVASELARAPRSTVAELAWAVRQAVIYRRTKVIVIDEAQHLGKVANAKLLHHQMEQVKDLADETGALIVLTGTYELLKLLRVTGQLCRRQECIHFGRYRAQWPPDAEAFRNVVGTLDEALPFPEPCGLLDHEDFLYTGSLGCVGNLKDWLTRALTRALSSGATSISKDLLDRTVMAPARLKTIVDEIREGEREIYESKVEFADIAALLGLHTANRSVEVPNIAAPNLKLKPGERKPRRDPVGLPTAA